MGEFSNLGCLRVPAPHLCVVHSRSSVNDGPCPFSHLVQPSCSVVRRAGPRKERGLPTARGGHVSQAWPLLISDHACLRLSRATSIGWPQGLSIWGSLPLSSQLIFQPRGALASDLPRNTFPFLCGLGLSHPSRPGWSLEVFENPLDRLWTLPPSPRPRGAAGHIGGSMSDSR